jgi:hypothetical protein
LPYNAITYLYNLTENADPDFDLDSLTII